MTLISEIIQRAYRVTNLIPIGATPTTAQSAEGLVHYNSLLMSTVGNEVSDGLVDVAIGGTYDQSEIVTEWVPESTRLLLNMEAATTFVLDPYPSDGQRFAVADVAGNLDTYNATIDGNGRNVEGASTLVLNTASQTGQWMYRADTGNWVLIEELVAADSSPFPTEFDDYFVLMLALRLDPSYGQALAGETLKSLGRARRQLQARYGQIKQILPDVDWRSVPSQRRSYTSYGSNGFNTGKPFPWI